MQHLLKDKAVVSFPAKLSEKVDPSAETLVIKQLLTPENTPHTLTRSEIQRILRRLQDPTIKIEQYFPADLADKQKQLEIWSKQIARAQACLTLLEHPLLQEAVPAQMLDQLNALSEAVQALNFTGKYMVKLIEPASRSPLTTQGTLPNAANEPTLFPLADSVESAQHAGQYSLASERSVWVDLPGGSVGQTRPAVRLQQAQKQLNRAFQQIEDMCWSYLRQHGVVGRDIQQLRGAKQRREDDLKYKRNEIIQKLVADMRTAWQQALADYDHMSSRPRQSNSFYRTLQDTYAKAVTHIYQLIDAKEFDIYIDIANSAFNGSPGFIWTISEKEGFTEIHGKKLRDALRTSLGSILEQSVQEEPARELAHMFLTCVEKEGPGTGGALDIEQISFGITTPVLDSIHSSYSEIINDVQVTACEVCRYVTMTDFVDSRHELAKDHALMNELYHVGDILTKNKLEQQQPASNSNYTPEYVLENARAIMKKMIDAMSDGMVENTYQRIALIYRYELAKLEKYTVYDLLNPGSRPTSTTGKFNAMANRLLSTLSALLNDPIVMLGAKIDGFIEQDVTDFDAWADFIETVRLQRRGA
ncbi:MAG: hypothetical protein E6J34_07545 [Chloroflexi bacterium]|nr:MAG: hypothetical protein E6J34_07545 [Chloroflexota bacterium]